MIVPLISAGAAEGLVDELAAPFAAASGATIESRFGPVAAIAALFLGDAPCDVFISTLPELSGFASRGLLHAETIAPIGAVHTALAVPDGHRLPNIATPAALAAALETAGAIYLPDIEKSTAGLHVRSVIARLGLADALMPRLRVCRTGRAAMQAMVAEGIPGALGCTQATEIIASAGVTLVGPLPGAYGLATIYGAAVAARAARPDLARRFLDLLTGPETCERRLRLGFEAGAQPA